MENGLREAIEKIEEMAIKAEVKIFDVHDKKYSTEKLFEIPREYVIC
jgi:hypothetical protein